MYNVLIYAWAMSSYYRNLPELPTSNLTHYHSLKIVNSYDSVYDLHFDPLQSNNN